MQQHFCSSNSSSDINGDDNSKNILAAYINRYKDAFYLQIMDSQQSAKHHYTTTTKKQPSILHGACIDVDTTDTK